MSVSQDDSESVDQFLARIASAKEGRDQASEERTRRMEEDFLKNRKERQARRLERARSLSPSKTGPSSSSSVRQNPVPARDAVLNPPVDFSPRASTLTRSNARSAKTSPQLEPQNTEPGTGPPHKDNFLLSSSTTGLSRNGTLSWQQRPSRDGGLGRPRPLSSIETARSVSQSEGQDHAGQAEPTRQQIAASLGMKDPSWFRQTQERGLGSAAFRKNQVEDTATVEHRATSQSLPGMSREGSASATNTPVRNTIPSLAAQADDKPEKETSPVPRILPEALKLPPPPQQPTSIEASSDVVLKDLARTGSVLARRSPSPTKGLGGFVESAMMKRSDSVNKRWSVQANAGLKRGDSVAGMRPLSGMRSMHAASLSRTSNRDGSSSPLPTSRPESRDGIPNESLQTVPSGANTNASEAIVNADTADVAGEGARPKTPENQLSRSPSKALDAKRWSPTKSSWLESALLSKPEPPKPKPTKDDTPAWKASLQRNKASRDMSPDKTEIATPDIQKSTIVDSKKDSIPPRVLTKTDSKSKDTVAHVTDKDAQSENLTDGKDTLPSSATEATAATFKVNKPVKPDSPKPDLTSVNIAKDKSSGYDVPDRSERKAPPAPKPKPQTPPKTDFRSTLKTRAPASLNDSKLEPEFKSVFGKLKPTQTQNYVAPDVLKNNILSGKAGLNITNGPQKTQRVDEFKQSILQKKEAMKAEALQKKENPVPEMQPPKAEPVVPEALARRKTLSKASAPTLKFQKPTDTNQKPVESQPKPVIAPKPKVLDDQPPTTTTGVPMAPARSPKILSKPSIASLQSKPPVSPSPTSIPENPGPRALDTKLASKTTQKQEEADHVPASVASMIPEKAELPPGSKLVSRLNPNLAAFLSRGSAPQSGSSKPSSPERPASEITKLTATDNVATDSAPSGELTHMTKGRAKGPKRRAPKSQPAQTVSSSLPITRDLSKPAPTVASEAKSTPVKPIRALRQTSIHTPSSPVTPSLRESPATSPVKAASLSKDQNEIVTVKARAKPAVASKSPELRRVSGPDPAQQPDVTASKPANTAFFEIAKDHQSTKEPEPQPAKRELPATPKPVSSITPLTPSKSRINTPKPMQIHADPPPKPQIQKAMVTPNSTIKQPPKKPVGASSDVKAAPDQPKTPSTGVKVHRQQAADQDLANLISTYFTKLPDKQQRADFDAVDLLSRAQQPAEKIKSLTHTIMEVNGDGKKSPMPPQQEHILYEESMYLVSHTFELGITGKSSDVYLWCGDAVSSAAIEDAQLFCRKDARDYNAKLELVKQGQEPARFFQALGGILITRRNNASSLYMLRGRRHLGHIAFDEVDMTPSGLCSGFSHLVSAKFGKLYLWKGKGSGADEVGCARLIGMDVGLTGEIEEIAEGEEPASFWESFSELSEKGSWSENWQQRAQHKCYPTTLYRVDVDRSRSAGGFWGLRAASPPKSSNKVVVDIINPFSHRDLEATNVYVLDAYRSVYVILDPQATSKSVEVVTALHLAQELAMLSPSIQDRSLLPSCFVALGDPPPDVKICFRKWSENGSAQSGPSSACVQLEQFMDVLQL